MMPKIMRRAPGNLAHLDASLTTLGEAYEFLTMAMIIMQRGWTTAIPEPDRGADILAFNNVVRNTVPVQVKAARVLTAGYPQVRAAAREVRHAYQIDISARQLQDLDEDPQPFVVWLVREDVEPLALVLDSKIMTAIRECRPGAADQLNIFFYQSLTDPHDILYHSHVNAANQLRPYVEAWNACFPPNMGLNQSDIDDMIAAATENLTIHYLLLLPGGWTAAKPHPDRGADILAMQNHNDIIIPCQVKASSVILTSNGALPSLQGFVPFHYNINRIQADELIRRQQKTIFVCWMCFTVEFPYRWEPLIFRGDRLIQDKPGNWNAAHPNFWAYATLNPQAATDANNHADKPIQSICLGGPVRHPIDVRYAHNYWGVF